MSWGSPLCKVFLCIHEYSDFVFGMELLRSEKLVPFIPYFYLSITLFFILSFWYLPIHIVGCNLKSPGVAHEAQLLVTVGRGGVRSVRIFKAKLRKVIKGTGYPFVRVKMYLPYDSKKREVVLHPRGALEQVGPKVFGLGCL